MTNRFSVLNTVIGCLLAGSFSFSQTRIQSLSENEISVSVNSIAQDKMGFIWIATNEGILKYNGYDYKLYSTNTGVRNAIPKNISPSFSPLSDLSKEYNINALAIDSLQKIWIAVNNRTVIRVNAFTSVIEKSYEIGIKISKTPRINQLYADSKNHLWLCASDGLHIFRYRKVWISHCISVLPRWLLKPIPV